MYIFFSKTLIVMPVLIRGGLGLHRMKQTHQGNYIDYTSNELLLRISYALFTHDLTHALEFIFIFLTCTI